MVQGVLEFLTIHRARRNAGNKQTSGESGITIVGESLPVKAWHRFPVGSMNHSFNTHLLRETPLSLNKSKTM